MNKGLIHIYTGNGKGKTTAAIGLAIRAAGAGKKILFAQFLKDKCYCEHISLDRFKDCIDLRCYGAGLCSKFMTEENKEKFLLATIKGYEEIIKLINENYYDVIILDEIFVALSLNLLSFEQILYLMENKPPQSELILTGRGAPQFLMEKADLITEMVEVKHYYKDKGITARKGIEM
ncbi:MAG: cob(I)yrinic acid a,c-diamide adenosyltransferase [Chitinispirillaceae bacterium]|nr:cob(I)yrinic acid a,c-diamide adenosyltransferase [Chitinispirillaceae bacterium]